MQVNTLIYTMGDRADDILCSLTLTAEDRKKYDKVKEKFDEHFVGKRNVIYERARFNMRRQEEGEYVDMFITAIYELAEHCGYGELNDVTELSLEYVTVLWQKNSSWTQSSPSNQQSCRHASLQW